MRKALLGAAFLLFGMAPVRADEQADGLALIDKAIKAIGGDAKAAKLQTVKVKLSGKIRENDAEKGTVTADLTLQGFDKFRIDLQLEEQGQQRPVLLVFQGTQGWAKLPDKTEPAPQEIVPVLQQVCYAARMPQMLTALKDQEFHFSPAGELKIGDHDALGVRITHKDHRDVTVYFDKATHLPIKCDTRYPDPSGQEKDLEFNYGDYKELDGVKHCQKFFGKAEGGKVQFELEVSEVKPQEKLGDDAFAMP